MPSSGGLAYLGDFDIELLGNSPKHRLVEHIE